MSTLVLPAVVHPIIVVATVSTSHLKSSRHQAQYQWARRA